MNVVPKSEIHNAKFDIIIEVLLILLLILTPIAFGSQVLWAFSLMELCILLIIILGAVKVMSDQLSVTRKSPTNALRITSPRSLIPHNYVLITTMVLFLFLGLVLVQMVPLPEGIVKLISPKTYELRNQLSAVVYPQSSILNPQSQFITLSFFPLATKVEFLKWLSFAGLFMFLLHWRLSDNRYRIPHHLIWAVFLVAVFESLYGTFEFLTGHRHVLNLDYSKVISHVTGTFANRNCFAGYLLMAIPLSIGFFFSREAYRYGRPRDWRQRLSALDGKTLLVGFGLILMILALLLSQSRAGIISLLLSFSLVAVLFRDPTRGEKFSRAPVLIFGLAVLWAAWIGLDAAINRFFSASESFTGARWPLWVGTFEILKDFPVLGSGLGTFTEVYSMHRTRHLVGLDIQAENDFLQLTSELGLIGAGLLLVLFLFLSYKAGTGIRSLAPGEPQRYIGLGGLVGILALMLHSIVQKNLQLPANAFLYTVMWAMVLTIALDPNSKRIAKRETPGDQKLETARQTR